MHDSEVHIRPSNGSLPLTFNDTPVNESGRTRTRGAPSIQPSDDHVRSLVAGVVAWVSTFAGITLLANNTMRSPGVALIGLGAALAVWTRGRQPRRAALAPDTAETSTRMPWQLALCGVGLVLAALLTWEANVTSLRQPRVAFGEAGWLWVLSMTILVVSTTCWPRSSAAPPASRRPVRIAESLIFTALVAVAILLRVWDLAGVPFAIHPDEIITGQVATLYLGARPPSIFTTLWYGINLPALWFAAVAASLQLGGHTLTALRLPAALFGAATVIPFYGFVRGAWGRSAAMVGTLLLAVSACNLQYSRITLNNIVTPFFWAVCFFFLLRGLRRQRPVDWAAAGLAGGLSEYGYYGTRLLPFILASFGGYLLVVHWRRMHRYVGHLAILALGYVVGFGPLLGLHMRNPGSYFGRGAQVLIVDHTPRGTADLMAIADRFWLAMKENLLVFSTDADQSSCYWAPLLLPAEAALVVIGTALFLWRWKDPASFLMLLTSVGVLVVGGTLVPSPGFIAHWTPAFPAFFAAAAVPLGEWADNVGRSPLRRVRTAGATLLLLGLSTLAWQNVDFYFRRYQVTRPEPEIRAVHGRWYASLGTAYRVRTVGNTWQPYDPELTSYLIAGQDGATLNDPPHELPLPGAPGKGLAFAFFPHEQRDEYEALVYSLYPGGTTGEVKSHARGIHLFSTYVVGHRDAEVPYGVRLELTELSGRQRPWTGQVARIGDLPPAISPPLRARWSGWLYLARPGGYRIELVGPPTHVLFDDLPGLPPIDQKLPQGWHSLVVEADLWAPTALRLQLGDEVPAGWLFPAINACVSREPQG